MTEKRKKIALIVLLTGFFVSLAYKMFAPYEQATVQKLTYTGRISDNRLSDRQHTIASSDLQTHILFDMLNSNNAMRSGRVERNIFKIKKSASDKYITPIKKPEAVTDPVKKVEAKKPKPPLPLEQDKIRTDLEQYRIFGSFDRGKERILFLERGKDILVVKQGDLIDGKYLVEQITPHRVTFNAIQTNESIYIDLGDE